MLFFRCRPSLHHFRTLNSTILAEKMDFVFHACSSLCGQIPENIGEAWPLRPPLVFGRLILIIRRKCRLSVPPWGSMGEGTVQTEGMLLRWGICGRGEVRRWSESSLSSQSIPFSAYARADYRVIVSVKRVRHVSMSIASPNRTTGKQKQQ
ncbi:unnamed protein product, partial [Nesidiocoris tenuis]